jgi:hypothetical protein
MTNYKQMDKVLELIAKTGDRVIVVSEHHDPYVLMTIKEYEALLRGSSAVNTLTEDELLDKINRDIAIWKTSQDDLKDYSLDQFKVDSLRKNVKTTKAVENKPTDQAVDNLANQDDDKYYIEPID